MNIEVILKKIEDSKWSYILKEITVSPRSYRLPNIPNDLLRYSSFYQNTFVISVNLDSVTKSDFLQTLTDRLNSIFAEIPANPHQVTQAAKDVIQLLRELNTADQKSELEDRIDGPVF